MFILRILGGWSLIAAVMALVYDLTLLAQGVFGFASIGQHWQGLNPASYASVQATVVNSLHPLLWSPLITTILAIPAWLFLGILGAALYALGRRRNTTNVFAN